MNNLATFTLLFTAALFWAGCAGPKPKETIAQISGPDTLLTVPKGDTVGTIILELGKLDSTARPEEYAADLYDLALANFLKLAPDDERIPEIMFWKANNHYNRGLWNEAVEIYSRLRKEFPASDYYQQAGQMMAQAYMQTGKNREAEGIFRGMLEKGEVKTPEARMKVAQALYLQGQNLEKDSLWDRASEVYIGLAKEFPEVEIAPAALYNAGVLQEKREDWRKAISIYQSFFEGFYTSDLLPKVLFREAKSREKVGDWSVAAQNYLNLVRAHPNSSEAEPALYNAGFAWLNGQEKEKAAETFSLYARNFPDKPEAPNLLFRAAEAYMESQNWARVEELQTEFVKRYGTDKQRLIQALCMGGTAAFHQKKYGESADLMRKAIAQFIRLGSDNPGGRYYAAQAQFTLGEIKALDLAKVTFDRGSYEQNLGKKTGALRSALEEYAKVFEFRISDWALRASFSIGELFTQFGEEVYLAARPGTPQAALDRETDALSALAAAQEKAVQQYLQVITLARQQEINNQWVERAHSRLVSGTNRFRQGYADSRTQIFRQLAAPVGNMEKAIAVGLERAGYLEVLHAEGIKFFRQFSDSTLRTLVGPTLDSLGTDVLNGSLRLGRLYFSAAELARSAPIPENFSATERFYYKVKLVQEGIPKLESQGMERFEEGLGLSHDLRLKLPMTDSLSDELGRTLFVQARCFDLLAREALVAPPIPPGTAQSDLAQFRDRFDDVGMNLQDEAIIRYRSLVEKASQGAIPLVWGEFAWVRLYEVEPDKWSRDEGDERIVFAPWKLGGLSREEVEAIQTRVEGFTITNFPDVAKHSAPSPGGG